MIWQKRVRIVLAVFGIACAILVYSAIGTRRSPGAPAVIQRLDPKAILESQTGFLQQVRGDKQDYHVAFDRQLTYQDGSTKMFGVSIKVTKKEGRDFVVSAREAQATGPNQQDLQLTGELKLAANDGFELTTDSAVFNQEQGLLRAAGKVAFRKDRMNGWGTGMTYDKNSDVLVLAAEAHVEAHDENGNVTLDADAGSATLDRVQDVLQLSGGAVVMREQQVIEGDAVTAQLSADDNLIKAMEIRGNARVEGGATSLNSMSAGDIDLHYSEDGKALQRVVLTGNGAISLKGATDATGRQLAGDTLDLRLAADGALTGATGRNNVTLIMPASGESAARGVRARSLDATGEAGKGLTQARFTDEVVYREEPLRDRAARSVRSRTLQMGLTDVGVSSARFRGGVTFEEQGLKAAAADADYQPADGRLELSGAIGGSAPCVADEQIRIEGQTIAVTLQGRGMSASGNVKTTLHPAPGGSGACAVDAKAANGADASRLPGLLKQDQPANVNADTLEYRGAAGTAVYTGNATLWQGETVIRGDVVTIDQAKGDVVALGSAANLARSAIVMDPGAPPAQGRAVEIRYDDARRLVTYGFPAVPIAAVARGNVTGRGNAAADRGSVAAPPAPAGPPSATGVVRGAVAPGGPPAATPQPGAPLPPALQPLFTGPQGVLKADRIEIVLAKTGSALSRLEGYTNVTLTLGTPRDGRTATGARLTYHAEDERYDMTGTALVPLALTEPCRQITGKTLTFYKSADRIVVDGNQEIRTSTKSGSGAACTSTPAASSTPAATPAPR